MTQPVYDDELKLEVAKLVCCGARGCMKIIRSRPDDPVSCWCESPDFKGSNTDLAAQKIIELFR